MAILFTDQIAAIKAKVPIVQFLRDEGIYAGEGVETQIRCFGHEETRPSARVYAKTNTVYCWVCNKIWDVVSGYQTIHETDIKVAVKTLVDRYNVIVEGRPGDIQHFYNLAYRGNNYKPSLTSDLASTLEKRFVSYVVAIDGWQTIREVIEHLIQEFYIARDTKCPPIEHIIRLNTWYIKAIKLVDSYKPMLKDIVETITRGSIE